MPNLIGRYEQDKLEAIGDTSDFSLRDPAIIALRDRLRDEYCSLAAWGESGARALGLDGIANLWARGRKGSSCYSGTPPPLTKEEGRENFSGGQCEFNYIVNFTYDTQQNAGNNSFVVLNGPILYSEHVPGGTDIDGNPNFGSIRIYHGNPVEERRIATGNASNYGIDGYITGVTPGGGANDTCGDSPFLDPKYPDGRELPPSPSPGDSLGSPGDRRVNIGPDGNQEALDVPESAPEFLGPEGIKLCFGTRCFLLTPEGDVWGDEPSFSPRDGNPEYGPDDSSEEIKNKLDEIEEALKEEISGNMEWPVCEGEEGIVRPYQGLGIKGLESAILALSEVAGLRVMEFCGEGEGMELERVLVRRIEISQGRNFYDAVLPAGTLFVDVECTSNHSPYAVSGDNGNGNDSKQTRYAQVSLLCDDGNGFLVFQTWQQMYSMQRYQIPEEYRSLNAARISLYPGGSAEIYAIVEIE